MTTVTRGYWRRIGAAMLLGTVVLLSLATLLVALRDEAAGAVSGNDPLLPLRHAYWLAYSNSVRPLISSQWLYIGLPCLLLAQTLWPASRQEGTLNTGLLHDSCWAVIHGVTVGSFIWTFLQLAHELLDPWTAPLRLGLLQDVPAWAEIVIGYLLIELLGWFNHMLRHKVKVLWIFHEVHHSQAEMNPFTLFRVHPVDYLIAEAIILLPSVLFEESLGVALAYLTIARIHDALNHSNIRTNLGWLRFVFVTPQSHRVHHAADAAFHDMNFGVTLSVWDRLFGTHAPSDFVYPETGIPDRQFPLETRRSLVQLPATLLAQLAYPFVKAANMCWRSPQPD